MALYIKLIAHFLLFYFVALILILFFILTLYNLRNMVIVVLFVNDTLTLLIFIINYF